MSLLNELISESLKIHLIWILANSLIRSNEGADPRIYIFTRVLSYDLKIERVFVDII